MVKSASHAQLRQCIEQEFTQYDEMKIRRIKITRKNFRGA